MSWETKDESYLLNNWEIKSLPEIMEFLDKSHNSVIRKAGRMGLNICKDPTTNLKRKWTIIEDTYMFNNYNSFPLEELTKHLNRTRQSIIKRAQYLELSTKLKRWTEVEINFLKEYWGLMTIQNISKKLKRTMTAVSLKACQLHLREQIIGNGCFLTAPYISDILNIRVRTIYHYMVNDRLHFRKFPVGKIFKYQISIDSFLEFLENNSTLWNSNTANMKIIGAYYSCYNMKKNEMFSITTSLPTWLKIKIQYDSSNILLNHNNLKWTNLEDKLLCDLKKRGCSLDIISVTLHRTSSAIKTRIYVLGNNNLNN